MIIFILLMAGLYAALLYWLLPVAPQSMISADTISAVWAKTSFESLHPELINTVWRGTVSVWRSAGEAFGGAFGGALDGAFGHPAESALVYPTVAALHAWFVIVSLILVLWRVMRAAGIRDKGFALLIVSCSTPAFLWSSVVPTGFSIAIAAMTIGWFLSFNRKPTAVTLAGFFEGLAIGLNVAGVVPVLYRFLTSYLSGALRASVWRDRSLIPSIAMPLGFLLGFTTVVALSNGVWPAYSAIVGILHEDRLGAGTVLLGGGGELRLALVGALSWAFMLAAQTALQENSGVVLSVRAAATGAIVLFGLLLQFGLFATRAEAWRLAHPGWNSILADAARSVEDGHAQTVAAYFPSPTEWSLSKYVQIQRGEKSRVTPYLSVPDDVAVQALLKEKKTLWLTRLPSLERGAHIEFLGYGFLVRALAVETGSTDAAPTQFSFGLNGLRGVTVRSVLGLTEVVEPKPLEMEVYERYAIMHLALARKYTKQRQPKDWERRAYLEQFAALRKVPWTKESYRAVCIEHPAGEEPEAYCSKVKSYYERLGIVAVRADVPQAAPEGN